MAKNIFIIFFLLLFCYEGNGQKEKLICSLESPFDTVMIGQPMYFLFQVRNENTKPVVVYYDSKGENENILRRDESFQINVYDVEGSLLENRKSPRSEISVRSRFAGFHELSDSDALIYKHWINDWVIFKRPGRYTVECIKSIAIRKGRRKVISKSLVGRSFLEVVPLDSIKLSDLVNRMWNDINCNKSDDILELFSRLESDMIIPYLGKVISESTNTSWMHFSMRGLSKFNKNEQAFEFLRSVFSISPDRFLDRVTKSELLPGLLGNLKLQAIHCMSKFDDSLLISFYLDNINDSYYGVRLYLMQDIYKRNRTVALSVIETYLTDENEVVKREAERYKRFYEE